MKKIAEVMCGFIIAGAGIALWHWWHVDDCLAALMVLVGLIFIDHAFRTI